MHGSIDIAVKGNNYVTKPFIQVIDNPTYTQGDASYPETGKYVQQ
jgi:hypothetical protein